MGKSKTSFHPYRRPLTLVNIVVSTMLALMVVIGVNYLGSRHPIRLKWVEHDRFELSPLTEGILNSLTNRVEVTVYQNEDKSTALNSSINGLLAEYAFQSPMISVRQIDYLRDRKAAQELALAYDLSDRGPSDLVIFAAGDRFRIVTHQELRDYQTAAAANAVLQGQREVKRVGFKGELLFTSAILALANDVPVKVAYLVGHGEHDLENEGLDGYAGLKQLLKEKNFEVTAHHLLNDGPLPADVPMLIIAGARGTFGQQEINEIDRFLQRGGRLLLLFNFNALQQPTGLEQLAQRWGVNVGMNLVDDVHKLMGTELVVADYEDHPTTTPLVDSQGVLLMFLPRSIDPLPPAPSLEARQIVTQGIAFTSTNGVTKSDIKSGRLEFSHFRDRRGAIPVLTAVEAEVSPNIEQSLSGKARLLVAGDSFFLANARLDQYGNRDFATLAAGWLVDQYQLLQGIGPQPIYEFKLNVPDPNFRQLQVLMLVALPGAVFGLGLIVWWRRRV